MESKYIQLFVPLQQVGKSEKEVKSLREEIKIQTNLANHPNIIRALNPAEINRELIVASEFASNLAQEIEKKTLIWNVQ